MVGKRDAEILGGLDGHCFPVVITIYPGSTLPMVVIFEVSGILAAMCLDGLGLGLEHDFAI